MPRQRRTATQQQQQQQPSRAARQPGPRASECSSGGTLSRGPSAGRPHRRSVCAGPTRAEALAQLRETAELLGNTPQGQGSDDLACLVRAAVNDAVRRHPEAEVRLWAAICLVEGLRIFAPTPPLDAQQLQETFELFIEQIGQLAEGTDHCTHLLDLVEKLVQLRVFALALDNSNWETLVSRLVATSLGVARFSDGGKALLDISLAKLLVDVLSEADTIPKPVLNMLLQALSAASLPFSTALSEHAPARSAPASAVIRRVMAGLARGKPAVQINDFLLASLYGTRTGSKARADSRGQDYASSTDANHLLTTVGQLYAIDEALVCRVLPRLQEDLQCAHADRRRVATKVTGQILSQFDSDAYASSTSVPLLVNEPLLLSRFLERAEDVEESVRLEAVVGIGSILATSVAIEQNMMHSGCQIASAVRTATMSIPSRLAERCLDPSDDVRLRVVEIAAEVALHSIDAAMMLNSVLPQIFRRILDRRPRIRDASARLSSKLYAQYSLPAWIEGRCGVAESLAWVPQLLCESYLAFVSGRVGYTSEIEFLIEQHILGCGAEYTEDQRAQALFGFYACVSKEPIAAKGFDLLMSRKRDANAALQRLLSCLREQRAPMLDDASASQALVTRPAERDATEIEAEATATVDALARCSPMAENRAYQTADVIQQVHVLSSVRNEAFWTALEKLCGTEWHGNAQQLGTVMCEMDDILRAQHLTDMGPLVRRSCLKTWLSAEQVGALLSVWADSSSTTAGIVDGLDDVLWQFISALPRYVPVAFFCHAERICRRLCSSTPEEVRAALAALARIAKHAERTFVPDSAIAPPTLQADVLTKALQQGLDTIGAQVDAFGKCCSHAVRSLQLLESADRPSALEQLLQKAEALYKEDEVNPVLALHLACSCLQSASRIWSSSFLAGGTERSVWILRAHRLLDSDAGSCLDTRCAAISLCASVDAEGCSGALHEGSVAASPELMMHAICSALRSIRHGSLQLTTFLLSALASQALAVMPLMTSVDLLHRSLHKMQKSVGRMTATARVRVCSTLPVLFALAPQRPHREAMQRLLNNFLSKALRESVSKEEPLLDCAIASFIHFLSRLEPFVTEATAAATAYPQSSKLAAFFTEALMKVDPSKNLELCGVALRTCDKARFFVDREYPDSDAVHKAAYVLRYVVERRCPQLGGQAARLLESVTSGNMPSELFVLRQRPKAVPSRGPVKEKGPAETNVVPACPEPALFSLISHEKVCGDADAGNESAATDGVGGQKFTSLRRKAGSLLSQDPVAMSLPTIAAVTERSAQGADDNDAAACQEPALFSLMSPELGSGVAAAGKDAAMDDEVGGEKVTSLRRKVGSLLSNEPLAVSLRTTAGPADHTAQALDDGGAAACQEPALFSLISPEQKMDACSSTASGEQIHQAGSPTVECRATFTSLRHKVGSLLSREPEAIQLHSLAQCGPSVQDTAGHHVVAEGTGGPSIDASCAPERKGVQIVRNTLIGSLRSRPGSLLHASCAVSSANQLTEPPASAQVPIPFAPRPHDVAASGGKHGVENEQSASRRFPASPATAWTRATGVHRVVATSNVGTKCPADAQFAESLKSASDDVGKRLEWCAGTFNLHWRGAAPLVLPLLVYGNGMDNSVRSINIERVWVPSVFSREQILA